VTECSAVAPVGAAPAVAEVADAGSASAAAA